MIQKIKRKKGIAEEYFVIKNFRYEKPQPVI